MVGGAPPDPAAAVRFSVRTGVLLTLRVILRASMDHAAILAAAVAVGALAGVGIVYLALMFGDDRLVDF